VEISVERVDAGDSEFHSVGTAPERHQSAAAHIA
jgi:hypothetical protein